MHDSLINPFDTLTDELSFMNLESTTIKLPAYPSIAFNFKISENILKYQRNRYSFWKALGDIGGFNDGMCLVIKIFMTPISASFFFNSFTHGTRFKKKSLSAHTKRSMMAKDRRMNYDGIYGSHR